MTKFKVAADETMFLEAKDGLRRGTRLRSLLKGVVQNDIEMTAEAFAGWMQDCGLAMEEYRKEIEEEIVFARGLLARIVTHVTKVRVDERVKHKRSEKQRSGKCPYPGHADDCDCEGMGGDR